MFVRHIPFRDMRVGQIGVLARSLALLQPEEVRKQIFMRVPDFQPWYDVSIRHNLISLYREVNESSVAFPEERVVVVHI